MKKSFLFLALISLILSFSCKDKPNDNSTQTAKWEQLTSYPTSGNASSIVLVGNSLVAFDRSLNNNLGIRTSTNSGISWSSPKYNSFKYGIAPFATDGINLYIGVYQDGVYKSSDLGQTWSKLSNGIPVDMIAMYVYFSGSDLYVCGPDGIYYSTDNGTTWKDIGFIGLYMGLSITASGNSVFASTISSSGNGLYKSSDKGINWTLIDKSSGLTDTIFQKMAIFSGIIYAANDYEDSGNVFTSSNLGYTWIKATGLKDKTHFIPTDFAQHNGVVFLSSNNGVYKSSDNGKTWSNTGGPNTVTLQVIGNTLFAGTTNSGIWKLDL